MDANKRLYQQSRYFKQLTPSSFYRTSHEGQGGSGERGSGSVFSATRGCRIRRIVIVEGEEL